MVLMYVVKRIHWLMAWDIVVGLHRLSIKTAFLYKDFRGSLIILSAYKVCFYLYRRIDAIRRYCKMMKKNLRSLVLLVFVS